MPGAPLLSGLVLAGGRARRMQSPGVPWIDKGLADFHGRPLIAEACSYLAARAWPLFISANSNGAAYSRYGTVVSDDVRYGEFAGPLAGIASVLARIPSPWLVVIPVDVVNLPEDMVRRLFQAAVGADGHVAYAVAERPHPLCMVLHRDACTSLRHYLDSGERRVMGWLESRQGHCVHFDAAPGAFKNINSLSDLT